MNEIIDTETGEVINHGDVADNVAGELVDCLLTEIKMLSQPWSATPKEQQQQILERLQSYVGNAVRTSVRLIAGDGNPAMNVAVDQVVFKDGVKVVLKTVLKPEAAHVLADMEGKAVVLVACDPDAYMGGIGDDRTDDNQGSLEV